MRPAPRRRPVSHTPNADDGNCLTAITCSVCGTTTTPAKDSHTGGTATCTEKAVCTVCSTAYGAIDANNHIDENTDHICDRECGKTDIGTHADSAEDNDHVCDYGCKAIIEDHKGGTATCVAQAVCTICGNGYGELAPENHDFGSGNTCICGAEIAFTGIVVDDEISDEYRYDETSKTYTIIIPADEVGGTGYLSYDIIGTNLTLIEDTNTLLKVQHENEDGLSPAPDDLLVDVLQDRGCFRWSVLGYRDGEWEKLLYSNDGGMTWTTYTFEVKQAYSITVNASQNGTVTANEYAIKGDNIALNVSPAEGYMLATLSVTDASGNTIVVENNQFTMPASAVTVNATFAVCDHKDSRHETATDNDDGTHSFTCTVCGVTGTENHTFGESGLCICGAEAPASVSDGYATVYADIKGLSAAIIQFIESGKTKITVDLPEDAPVEMLLAVRRALIDAKGVVDGSVDLTLKGVTRIPGYNGFGIFGAWILPDSSEEIMALGSITLTDATYIESNTFYYANYLSRVSAPLLTEIASDTFSCSGISEVYFPRVEKVGGSAFDSCYNLSEISLPSAKEIRNHAFSGCDNLTKVSLPSASVIGSYVFQSSKNITELTLGELTSVDDRYAGIFNAGADTQNIRLNIPCTQKAPVLDDDTYWVPTDVLYSETEDYQNNVFMRYTFASVTLTHDFGESGVCVCGETAPVEATAMTAN